MLYLQNKSKHMKRYILSMAFAMMSALSVPLGAVAMGSFHGSGAQVCQASINISVEGGTLHISGADGMVLEVVSLTGRKVATVKIESQSQRVELNVPKGCYILKVGNVVRKVTIR